MSFWDKLRNFLSGSGKIEGTLIERAVGSAFVRRANRRETFTDREIAEEVLTVPSPQNLLAVSSLLERMFDADNLKTLRYVREQHFIMGSRWLFYAAETSAATARTYTPPPPRTPPPFSQAPQIKDVEMPNPYEATEILGLSADEMRKRALKINPFRTPWIGRVDTIPPQSDERTALIDRGLILRGFLTEEQIREIHRVGDSWLRHHDALRLAGAAAAKTAQQAVEAERERKTQIRAEKKRESQERKIRRAAEIARRKAEDIVYLGPGVSGLLSDRRSLIESLQERRLPVLSSPADVAKALGLPVPKLRWLSFHSEASESSHYVYFQIPKRSGGMRLLSAPHEQLARAQNWILENILEHLIVEEPAHGFIRGRSTVTNAEPHVRRDILINLDLTDFFPTITFRRVRGVFSKIGYSPAVSTVLALLCTESPRRPVEYEGKKYWVATGDRSLPQGACTSPALSNQVARKLDRRLLGMSNKMGWAYTRYADDMTFSAPKGKRGEVPLLLSRIRHIVTEEGFALNPKKGRVQRFAGRQSVTGVVVNDKPGVPRDLVRRIRAILHGARRAGLDAQNREEIPYFKAWLRGMIAYITMVDRRKGSALMQQLNAITDGAAEFPADYHRKRYESIPFLTSAPPQVKVDETAVAFTPSVQGYFEFISGLSRKFWKVQVEKQNMTVHFGRIGTKGQIQTKTFSSNETAELEAGKLIREKLRKGYVEKNQP